MNEELQKALASLLGKANDGIDTASDFLVAELPDVIQQLLMWHGIYSFILFMISTVGFTIATTLTLKVLLNIGTTDHWGANKRNSDVSAIGGVALIVSFFLFVMTAFTLNITWLQIWIAPKVWLIEYAAKLTN